MFCGIILAEVKTMVLSQNTIIENLDDGVLIIDSSGNIINANISAEKILGINSLINKKYADLVRENHSSGNDDFFDCILRAYSNKNEVYRKKLNYIKPDGTKTTLWVTSNSVMENNAFQGMLISFTDVTKEEIAETKRHDSTVTFIIVLVSLSLWLFVARIWENMGRPIPVGNFNKFMVLVFLIPAFMILKFTSLSAKDVGLSIKGKKKYFIIDIVATVICVTLMIIIKKLVLKYNPGFFKSSELINWNGFNTFNNTFYAISVVAQEFMSRGVIHESFKRAIVSKHNDALAIIVSSLVFAAMHAHLGLGYMIGASLLLSIFGVIYSVQRSIWPLCIPHYVLGKLIIMMGFTGA